MKCSKIGLLAVAVLAFAGFQASAKKAKGESAKMNAGKPEIVDYAGQSLGAEVPAWVYDALAEDKNAVKKDLKLDNKKLWIIAANGSDLDFLKTWTDTVDVKSQVSNSLKETVANATQATLEGTETGGGRAEKTDAMDKAEKQYIGALGNVSIVGLEKEVSYWIQTRTLKVGKKKGKKDSDYNWKYTYYVVYSMDQASFDTQMEAALNNVTDNTEEAGTLRKVLTEKLKNEVGITATTPAPANAADAK